VTFWGTAMLHWYDIFSKRSRLLFLPHGVPPGWRGLALVLAALATISLLVACAVGPDYVRPTAEAPDSYKEIGDWKQAEPQDHIVRGAWWEIFDNPELNTLEEQIDISNQNVAAAEAQFRQALALVQVARAGYFPTLTAGASATRALRSTNTGVGNPATSGTTINDYLAPLTASWAIDVWGRVRRQVEAGTASAQASAALLESVRLLTQAQLAQNYFQLRALDAQKKLLDETITAYQTNLKLTQNRYASGVASRADVLLAETQLKSTQAQAIDIGVQRAQLEHAIAVLLGKPASLLSMPVAPLSAVPPAIPVGVPSELLERRPDIATAERNMAAANAQIGVAKAAFFPTVTLNGAAGYESSELSNWLTWPSRFWSLGAGVSEAVFEGGLRRAQTAAARAAYDSTVASYRQTVLTAFQQVEDNLAALRILEGEAKVQQEAVKAAQQNVTVVTNQYKAGTTSYLAVIVVQTQALSNEITALAIQNRRMIAAVNLIQALGGGWNASELAGK
jgi:NodT family efflux transporter outer membrane factor (OMF) lipoprotein